MAGGAQRDQRDRGWALASPSSSIAAPRVGRFVVDAQIEAPRSVLLLQRQKSSHVAVDLAFGTPVAGWPPLREFRVVGQTGEFFARQEIVEELDAVPEIVRDLDLAVSGSDDFLGLLEDALQILLFAGVAPGALEDLGGRT